MNTENPQDQTASFAALLNAAITEPGTIHQAYFAFHGYSIGNQLLALIQCAERGIAPGPIASFRKWQERGRHVQKGQKAIALWMPITVKRTVEQEGAAPGEIAFTRFILKRNWFVLAQTQGQEYAPEQLPNWDRATALQTLSIEEIPFDHIDGNVWGFARAKQVAVSPLSPMPERTLLHEIAHVVLCHTTEAIEQDGPRTPRSLREVEAEGAIAEFERERIRERVLVGLQPARAQGRKLGRPKSRLPVERLQRVAELPVHVAAERLGVSRSTVKRWRRQMVLPVAQVTHS